MYTFPSPNADRLLESERGLRFVQVGVRNIDNFTRFVYRVFVERIGKRQEWQPTEAEFQAMIEEERELAPHGFFLAALLPDGEIVGAMRAARWHPNIRLTTEKIFNIDPAVLAHQWGVPADSIWHASQMCVDTRRLVAAGYSWRAGIPVLRTLVKHLFRAVAPFEGRYALVESDQQINGYIKQFLQLEAVPISRTLDYIGQTHVAAIELEHHYRLPYIQAEIGSRIAR